MKKIIIVSLILITSIPNLFAGPPILAPKIIPNMQLESQCFTDLGSCNLAERILNLPSAGNFQLFSKCRPSNQYDAQAARCIGFRMVLDIRAIIDLPYLQQYQTRNQCHRNVNECNFAKQIWSQLNHPMNLFLFNAICVYPPGPNFWKMPPQRMDELGIFRCTPQNGPVELRIEARRIK